MSVSKYDKPLAATFNIGDHLIGCTKYRPKILTPAIQARLKELVIAQAIDLQARIETIEGLDDHVQVCVKASTRDSPHPLVKHFKAIQSFMLPSAARSARTRSQTTDTLDAQLLLRISRPYEPSCREEVY
jgi:putative transposase